MNVEHHLESQLKTLHLGDFLQTFDLQVSQAQKASMSYLDFLGLVIQDEIERREAKKLTLRPPPSVLRGGEDARELRLLS